MKPSAAFFLVLVTCSAGFAAETTQTTNETSRRLGQIVTRQVGTNSTAAAAAAKKAREEKHAKLVGAAATSFTPSKTIGDFKDLSHLKGKVVMLDFFAHWCGPCIASLPSVRSLSDDLKSKGLEVVGVTRFYGYYKTENRSKRDMSPDTELEWMKEFVQEKKINWPVAFVDRAVFESYACSAIPHVVLVDREGKIRKIKVGYVPSEADAFRAEIEKLLDETAKTRPSS
jgi:thiol-disulfide isomerase/thioredoxin